MAFKNTKSFLFTENGVHLGPNLQRILRFSEVYLKSLDFSKAFDSVRHSTLLDKMAQLAVPDEVYNWLVNFDGHSHCTHYRRNYLRCVQLQPALSKVPV